jgi:hypothetical protein
MFGAVTRDPSRDDFTPFSNEMSQYPGVFIIDIEGFIGTEAADLSLDINPSSSIYRLPHAIILRPISTGFSSTVGPQMLYGIRYDLHRHSE